MKCPARHEGAQLVTPGFVSGDHAPEMVLCCSDAHVMALLEEG